MIRIALPCALVVMAIAGASPADAQASAPGGACRPPAQNTTTFLPGLPVNAGYQVAALVELVDLVDARTPRGQPGGQAAPNAAASKVRVRVLAAFKGVGRNDTFVVDTGGGFCDEIVGLDRLGQTAFIAGRFVTGRDDRTYFVGQHDAPPR